MGKNDWKGAQQKGSKQPHQGQAWSGWEQGHGQSWTERPNGKGQGGWGQSKGQQRQRGGPYDSWERKDWAPAGPRGPSHAAWSGGAGLQSLRGLRSLVTNASDVLAAVTDIRAAMTGLFREVPEGSMPEAGRMGAAGAQGQVGCQQQVGSKPGGLQGLWHWLSATRPEGPTQATGGDQPGTVKPEAVRAGAPAGGGAPPGAEDVLAGLRAMLDATRVAGIEARQETGHARTAAGSAAAGAGDTEMAGVRAQLVALTQQIENIAAQQALVAAGPGGGVPGSARPDPSTPPRAVAAAAPPAASPAPGQRLPFSPLTPSPTHGGVTVGAAHDPGGQNAEIAELLALLRGTTAPAGPAGRSPGGGTGAVAVAGGNGAQVGGILRALRAGAVPGQPGQAGEAVRRPPPEADMTKARRLGMITERVHKSFWQWLDDPPPAGWVGPGPRDDWIGSMSQKARRATLVDYATKAGVATEGLNRRQLMGGLLDKYLA